MSQNSEMSGQAEFDPSVTTCGNCRAPMPLGLRFCRNCGFRLGEGTAEYTETVRFDGQPGAQAGQPPFGAPYAAPLAQAPVGTFGKARKKMSGMSWMFIGLLVFFLGAAAFTAIVTPIRRGIGGPTISVPEKPRVYFGVGNFDDAENGVTFDNVEPPGSPADKAGLVGGDIITSFAGKRGRTMAALDQMVETLKPGDKATAKFIRDGENQSIVLKF